MMKTEGDRQTDRKCVREEWRQETEIDRGTESED